MLSLMVIDSRTLRVKTSIVGGSFLLAGSVSALDGDSVGTSAVRRYPAPRPIGQLLPRTDVDLIHRDERARDQGDDRLSDLPEVMTRQSASQNLRRLMGAWAA
jgi:hypothetical protein